MLGHDPLSDRPLSDVSQSGAAQAFELPSHDAKLYANGQSESHVGNLIGFAGRALFWASAAALTLAPAQPQLQAKEQTFGLHALATAQAGQSAQFFKPGVHYGAVVAATPPVRPWKAGPQENPEQTAPAFYGQQPRDAQPELNPSGILSGTHALAIAQGSQSATFWFGPALFAQPAAPFVPVKVWNLGPQESLEQSAPSFNRSFFAPVVASIPVRLVSAAPQENVEQAQPGFSGQTPLPAPSIRAWNLGPQESQEQTAALFFGQQPRPSPAGKPIWTAADLQEGNQSASVWGGNADLFIAATQFNVPPGPFSAAPQESPEQIQPVVQGQQPLPSPASKSIWTAGEEQQGSQAATIWNANADLFIAATQFGVRPRAFSTGPQESPEQTQPVVFGQEPASAIADEITVRQFVAGPQESGEQTQPLFFGQQPLPSPVAKPIWTALQTQDGSQSAVTWGGNATLFIAQTQFSVPPRDSVIVEEQRLLDQTAPEFSRNFFAPVPIRTITAAPQADPEQIQPIFSGQQPATALVAPSFKPFTIAQQESPEQPQPDLFGQTPLPSPAFGRINLAPQESLEQASPLIFKQRLSTAVGLVGPFRFFGASPQEDQEQIAPVISRQLISDLERQSPAFVQFFAQGQYDPTQLQPVFINRPIPESQAPVVPPVEVGGGGDRDVNLLRGPKEEPKKRLAPATFKVRFFQAKQQFRARIGTESFFSFNGFSESDFDFTALVDASSEVSYRSSQVQAFAATVSVSGQVRSFAPVKGSFTALRMRVQFATGKNEMRCKFEVET